MKRDKQDGTIEGMEISSRQMIWETERERRWVVVVGVCIRYAFKPFKSFLHYVLNK